ncbi:MAG: ATP-binding cassette domain-containing protein, partial [Helicobacter sp.]|nr:ATP-binding cassette domain-containing protein [Helicobacter sp.]
MDEVLEIHSLKVDFKGFKLEDINFGIKKGEVLGLVGESGSGKSLLSHIVLG